jgi:hypothetical protein
MYRIIIYYEATNGVTSNLVEFNTKEEMDEAIAIIDQTGEESPLSYIELQFPPATIRRIAHEQTDDE